jgi:hypothetical protein
MIQLILLFATIVLGSIGYYLLISDIKKGSIHEKNIIHTGKAHYWFLLFFVAGLTSISINAIEVMWNRELNMFMKLLFGTILMMLYFITFIIRPSKYLIKKYKK